MDKKIDYTQFQYKPRTFMYFVARQYKFLLILTASLIILSEGLFSLVVYFLGKLTDSINNFASSHNSDIIYHNALLLIIVFAISFIFWRMSGFLGSYVTTQLEAFSLRVSFAYAIRHGYKYFSNRLVGKLTSKIGNIARSIETMFPMLVWDFLRIIVKFISLSIIAFISSIQLGWTFIAFIICFIIFNGVTSQKLARYAKNRAEKASELRGNIVDDLTNVMAVQQNVKNSFEITRINQYIEKHRFWHLKTWQYFETILAINSFFAIMMLSMIIFVSLHLWFAGVISIGIVVMAIVMTTRLIGDLIFMGNTFNRFMEQYGQLKEGLEEVFVPYDIVDVPHAKKVYITRGEIIFHHVDFHYDKDDIHSVFDNLSIKIPAGQKIGLVGESGAGKSTFVNLLLRFRDVDSGRITIDGYDIKKMRQDDLRGAIAYVPQEALLFHRTLEENILYGNMNATKDELDKVIQKAHAKEFISRFKDGLKTLVGERGVKLSGGQKQRVMIARAMLKSSPILVLDEATSSLDSHAEKLIQEALEELMKDRTTIVIAHRLSTLKKMDRIIVFDGGKIVEDGTHQKLLDKKGKYFELWQHQTNAIQ